MDNQAIYALLADLILIIHFSLVVFIVTGFAATVAGRFFGWEWIYGRLFRLSHLTAIGIIILQAWLGRLCPLTIWEQSLRNRAGQNSYNESFVQHWLHKLLFFEAELWVFGTAYTLFGLAVLYLLIIDRRRIGR